MKHSCCSYIKSNLSCANCFSEPPKSTASVVVKTVPAVTPPPTVLMMSSMKVPPIQPAPTKSTTVTLVPSAPPSTSPSAMKSASPVTIKPVVLADASCPAVALPVPTSLPKQTIAPPKAKTTLSISMSKPQKKLTPPPLVPPKPQSPVNAVLSADNNPPSPISTPTPVIGKPISSVPVYKSAPSTCVTQPSQSINSSPVNTSPSVPMVMLSPPVVVMQSVKPVQQGGNSWSTSSGRVTPSGRATPSGRRTPLGKPAEGSLRQGVPQKPYTFMDEKAR